MSFAQISKRIERSTRILQWMRAMIADGWELRATTNQHIWALRNGEFRVLVTLAPLSG